MKVSALEEYGLRCMILLARNGGGPMTLPEISEAEGLSLSYAGKMLMILKKADLVKAVRGRQGGYELKKVPEEYSLKEIFQALGDPLYNSRHCGKFTGENDVCVHTDDCTVRDIWKGFSTIINGFLDRMSLADVASGNYDFNDLYQSLKIDNRPNT